MTSTEDETILNLKYVDKFYCLPLKKGNNLILSQSFPEMSKNNIILFNLNIISENEASLRTFDYFPLLINFDIRNTDSSVSNARIQKELLLRKPTIIFINSLLNIQIFPLFTNNSKFQNKFFFFEKVFKREGNHQKFDNCDDSSKNIIFHLESKEDFKEISFEKEDYLNLKMREQINYDIIYQNLQGHNKILNEDGKTTDIDQISQHARNFKESGDVIIDNHGSPKENFIIKEEENEKNLFSNSNIEAEMVEIDKGGIQNLHDLELEKFCKDEQNLRKICMEDEKFEDEKISDSISGFTKEKIINLQNNREEERKSLIQDHSSVESSVHSTSSIKSNPNKIIIIKNEEDQYKIFDHRQLELIIPRKVLVIEDDEIPNKESKNVANSPDNNSEKNKQSIAPRQTRSSSKSLGNAGNAQLLLKKRKRYERHSDSKLNLNKENTKSNNNFFTNIDVNRKCNSTDGNVNVNETVNKIHKFYESRNNQIINSEAFKSLLSPMSEKLNKSKHKCTICLDILKNESHLDNCEHEFCKDCIDQWAMLSNECPLCKVEFKKIIYWDSDNKQVKKVKKRKFKYEEEEEEPWLRNCAENCMVCGKFNDEHLLLVCDNCSYNICHTYCAGLDLIPDEDWLCSQCNNTSKPRGNEINLSPSINSQSIPNDFIIKRKAVIVDDDYDEIKTGKNNSIVSNSSYTNKNKNSKNINIPISYKLKKGELNRNYPDSNLNLDLQITNSENKRKRLNGKLVTNRFYKKRPGTFLKSRYINQNERIRTRRRYNLRKKK